MFVMWIRQQVGLPLNVQFDTFVLYDIIWIIVSYKNISILGKLAVQILWVFESQIKISPKLPTIETKINVHLI